MRNTWSISRRTALKGLGVAMALPLLETMGWAETPKGGAPKPPVRLAFVHMPFGVQPEHYWPKDASAFAPAGALPPTLAPLRPVLNDCVFLDGIDNSIVFTKRPSPSHGMEIAGWLTGVEGKGPCPASEASVGTSADQLAAQVVGQYTALPSLELNCTYATLSGMPEVNYPDIYKHAVSWRSPTQPNYPEMNPRAVLNRLFSSRKASPARRGGPGVDVGRFAAAGAPGDDIGEATLDQSMLDVVMESAKDLQRRVSVEDRRTLDGYLECVRSLEKRIVAIERQQAEAAQARPAAAGANTKNAKRSDPITVTVPERDYGEGARNGAGLPFPEISGVMGDLMILAFQTDLTRVVTLMASSGYGRNHPELGFNESHHELSHNNRRDQAMITKIAAIERMHLEQFSRLIQRMRSLQEGGSSLLDNCMVLWGSGMAEGAFHTFDRLPAILAGRGGGTVRSGRYVNAKATQSDLLMSLLARMGVKPERPLGNSTKLVDL